MAGTLRWCKKCKVTFGEDKCPAGHAIFLYTKKIPVDSGDTAPTKNAGSSGGTAATSGETKAAGLQSSAGARTGESIADRIERQKKERFEASDEFKAAVKYKEEEEVRRPNASNLHASNQAHFSAAVPGVTAVLLSDRWRPWWRLSLGCTMGHVGEHRAVRPVADLRGGRCAGAGGRAGDTLPFTVLSLTFHRPLTGVQCLSPRFCRPSCRPARRRVSPRGSQR